MIKLPEPVMYKTPWGDLVTVDQMRQAIKDALEEAAKVCDAHDYYGDPMAIEIRALKEQIK